MFRKEDFKFGDMIILRNKEKFIYLGDKHVRNCNDDYITLYNWEENFKHIDMSELDIMKVQRYCIAEPTPYYILETLYERKEDILDEKEKQYLRNLINPFQSKVKHIEKRRFSKESRFCWLCIKYTEITDTMSVETYESPKYIALPSFRENTMYTRMKENYPYTLEELGL